MLDLLGGACGRHCISDLSAFPRYLFALYCSLRRIVIHQTSAFVFSSSAFGRLHKYRVSGNIYCGTVCRSAFHNPIHFFGGIMLASYQKSRACGFSSSFLAVRSSLRSRNPAVVQPPSRERSSIHPARWSRTRSWKFTIRSAALTGRRPPTAPGISAFPMFRSIRITCASQRPGIRPLRTGCRRSIRGAREPEHQL